MNDIVDHIQVVHSYSVLNVSGDNDIFKNGNYIIEKSVLKASTDCGQNICPENAQYETVNAYIPADECQVEKHNNSSESKNLLENKIIQVISSGDVENIFCLNNVKQEFSVAISDGFQKVDASDSNYVNQPLTYQDLNLIYAGNGILHVCDVCGKSFRKKSNLKRHYRSHTGDNPHACDQCDARFPTLSRLKEHLHAHTGLRPHSCNICGKSFSRVSNLTRHYRTHSAEKPYQCDKCEGRFVEPTRLREHYLTHVGEKRFACEVCHKRFLKKFNLTRHSRTHTGDRPHVCGTCGRGFSKKVYLLVHAETHAKGDVTEADSAIETVASNCVVETAEDHISVKAAPCRLEDVYDGNTNDQENEIFSCKQCNRHYIKKSSLLSHMKRHQEKDPLSCEVCGATFHHASRLREHAVTHSGEKSHVCAVCKRRFGRNSNLLRHLQTHTGAARYKCDACERRFSNSNRLREHHMSHTGEKPHKCNVCGKMFRHKFGLQRHLLVHTGEKPHKCNACGKRFSRRGRLVNHCDRQHGCKFPNRVEPRLMNIIQNLEARLGDPVKQDDLPKDPKTRSSRSRNARDPPATVCNSSEEMEEVTVEITSVNQEDPSDASDFYGRSLTKRTRSNHAKFKGKTCRAKLVKSELKSRSVRLPRKKSNKRSSKATAHDSKAKQSKNNTSESVSSKLCVSHKSKWGASRVSKTSKAIGGTEPARNNDGLVGETSAASEHIEIEDASVYQTQVIGSDLETFVLLKTAL